MVKIFQPGLEISLTEHCNLRCAGCDHGSPHLPELFTSFEQARASAEILAEVFHAGELKFAGGEPLLHPRLFDFLRMAQEIDLADYTTVITNGMLLHTVPEEFWTLVDRVWISIYPGVKYKVDPKHWTDVAARHGVALWLKESPAFFLALLNDENRDAALVKDIYSRCRTAHIAGCHTIHEGRYYKCTPAPFMKKRLALKGIEFENQLRDSVAIDGNRNLADDLARFIGDPEPLRACSYCLGTVGLLRPSTQLNKIRLAQELAEPHENVRELIDWEVFNRPSVVKYEQLPKAPEWKCDVFDDPKR
jgi:MoaA/NifB/PqqE/SkfB family radical SAM enzyme